MADDADEAWGLGGELTESGTVRHSGMLRKKKAGKGWKQRWCELVERGGGQPPRLVYRAKQGAQAKGILSLVGAWMADTSGTLDGSNMGFSLVPGNTSKDKGRLHQLVDFYFECADIAEKKAWQAAILGMHCVNASLDTDAYCSFEFDTLALAPDEWLPALVAMANTLGLPQKLGVGEEVVSAYFAACLGQMPPNAFHSAAHALDVTQLLYCTLRQTGLAPLLQPVQLLGVFLGAVAHDLQHTGTSNSLLISEGHEYASKCADNIGPLESHHARCALETLANHDVLAAMSSADAQSVREVVEKVIHCTDIGNHQVVMDTFKDVEDGWKNFRSSEFLVHGDKGDVLLAMLLKAADVSNPARTFEIAGKWNALIYEEFYAEGDKDKAAGREVNPMHDRDNNSVPKSSIGFINFLVRPIFSELLDFLKHCHDTDAPGIRLDVFQEAVNNLSTNAQLYQRQADTESSL